MEIKINNHDITYLFDLFAKFGKQLYLVGGSCRDVIMQAVPKDFDFATDAAPLKIYEIAKKHNDEQSVKGAKIKVIPTGIKYGTVTLLYRGAKYEITTFRHDSNATDGRRPQSVTFTNSIIDDLSRRDYTINAIAYSPKRGIIDPFSGIQDITQRIIRTVGDPYKRFAEDYLRIMRGIRFSCKLGFAIEENTSCAMLEMMPSLRLIAAERVNSELSQMLLHYSDQPLFETLINTLIPEIDTKNINNLHKLQDFNAKLAYLLSSADDPETVLRRLKFTNHIIKSVLVIISHIGNVPNDRINLKRVMRECGAPKDYANIISLFKIWKTNLDKSTFDKLSDMIKCVYDSNEPYTYENLAISGTELIDMGYRKALVGEIIDDLLAIITADAALNKAEYLTQYVTSRYQVNS